MPNTDAVKRKRIGELLLKAGIIKPEHLPTGLAEADKFQLRLGEMLVMLRFMSTDDLTNVLEAQSMLAAGRLDEETTVSALRLASQENLDFEDAVEKVKENAQSSIDSKKERSQKILKSIADKEKQSGPADRELIPLFLESGDLFQQLEQCEEAEKQYLRALYVAENSFGKSNLKLSVSLSRLTDLLFNLKRYSDAEPYAWRLIQICQQHLGPEHLETAQALQRMARIMEKIGRYVEAEQYYLSALRVKEKRYGPDHPELVDQLRQMSAFWGKQGKKAQKKRIGEILCEAGLLSQEQLQEAALAAQKKGVPLGQGLLDCEWLNPDLVKAGLQAQLLIADGVVPSELAIKALRICAKQEIALDEALEYIGWQPDKLTTTELKTLVGDADSLISAERTLGPDHCGVALACIKLADNYLLQKRYAEAESSYKRALGILEKFFGPKDVEVAACLLKLAELFYKQGKYTEAESYVWRSLEIFQREYAQGHADLAAALEFLADLKSKQCAFEQSEMFFKSALSVKEKVFGKESPRLISILEKAADIYIHLGRSEDSVPYYVRLVRLKQKLGEHQSPEVARLLIKLGKIYEKRNEFASAESPYELALEILESNLGREHPEVLDAIRLYALVLRNIGKADKAEELEERTRSSRSSGD